MAIKRTHLVICFDEGQRLETSGSLSPYGGNLTPTNLFDTKVCDCEESLILAENKIGGEIHVWRETWRINVVREIVKSRVISRTLCGLRVSPVHMNFSLSFVTHRNMRLPSLLFGV